MSTHKEQNMTKDDKDASEPNAPNLNNWDTHCSVDPGRHQRLAVKAAQRAITVSHGCPVDIANSAQLGAR
eukprot:scaffold134718_cov23-Prasinocladus_malaysianus.AAC.1